MKNILIFILLLCTICNAQDTPNADIAKEIYSPPNKEKLAADAYEVFKTNKFLDFKNRETLIEKIEGAVYKKMDLNDYFPNKKEWDKIEKEDITTFEKESNAQYSYSNNTLTEIKTEFGSYNVRKEIKTIYNSKCFVLLYEKKYFVGDNYNRTESTINEYINDNQVVKIIRKTEYPKKENNSQSVIRVKYEDDILNIASENGSILCEFIENKTPAESISKLTPNQTTDYFRYALIQQNIGAAKKHCTEKMAQKIESVLLPYPNITDINSLGGSGSFGEKVTINENWGIILKDNKTEKCNVVLRFVKQKNGWKIDDFEIVKKPL